MAYTNNLFSSMEFVREGFPDPFELDYIMGFNKKVGVKHYLNKKKEDCFVYCMSNILSIYNLQTKQFQNALGHHEYILSYDIDDNCKIMASADKFAVIIWDLRPTRNDTPVILRVIDQPFGTEKPILATGISRCGRYLLLASSFNIVRKKHRVSISSALNKKPNYAEGETADSWEHMIQFWEWALGRKSPDDRYRIVEDIGTVKSIAFSETNKSFFAVTYNTIVLFGVLEKVKTDLCQMKIFNSERQRYKNLHTSCYLNNSPYLVTSSRGGHILVWTETSAKHTNEKKYLKTLKIGCEVNYINCFDNFLVIADERGEISFMNYELKLAYKCSSKETGAEGILSVSPVTNKRLHKLWEPNDIVSPTEKHLELIPIISCPQDFADVPKPIVIRKFFFITSIGELYLYDPVYKKATEYLIHSDDIHITFDVFPIKPWLLICTCGGKVRYFNAANEMEVSNYYFAPIKREIVISDAEELENETGLKISTCRISNNEEFVAIGFENGDICMLDPITAKPISRKLMNFAPDKITHIIFSPENDRLCCYADDKYTIICIQYNAEQKAWNSLGNFRYHCNEILNIFFTSLQDKNYLLSVGSDRMYVKYALSNYSMVHKRDIRLEQTARITAAVLLDSNFLDRDTSKYKKVLLTANSHYKLVIYDAFTADNLFTFLGPVFESPIKKIIYLGPTEEDSETYFIFASNRTLGAGLAPLDGNPFRYSGVYAHYKNINLVRAEVKNWSHIFVLGDDDAGEFYWKINKENIRKKQDFGGIGLEPYCKLLPGGKSGWLFKEIQDYFFYIQLISDLSDAPEKKNVCDYMKTSEITTFMQAIGYFPSEFEVKNLTNEYIRTFGSFEAPPSTISFSNLFKLYINHRPVDGYKLNDIKDALKFITQPNPFYRSSDMIKLTLRTLLELLTDHGESIPRITAMKYIMELLEPKGKFLPENLTENEVFGEFRKLPKKFDFHDFCQNLLGLPIISKNRPVHHSVSIFQGKDDPSEIVPELVNRVPLIVSASDDDFVEIMSAASDQHEETGGRRKSRAPV